ncbi:MAG: hypothetical protein HY343_12245 [Lentisphaerae bacterium]|nr:hypothetical protein [Lentisphaerota bacterium]
MKVTPITLLKNRAAFWADVKFQRLAWRDLLPLAGFIVVACGLYGAALAGWRSAQLSLYVAVKLPVLFLATTALVSAFNWMLATLLGAGLSFKSTVFVLVSLQMTTCMRPLLAKPDAARGWWTTEKKFFLVHYGDCFEVRKTPAKPPANTSTNRVK